MTQRAYKFNFTPTSEQKSMLEQYFGCARFAWNHALDMRNKAYKRRGESLNSIPISRHLTQLKKTSRYQWLKDTPATIYGQKLRDLDTAFINFFKHGAKYPRFKKKLHSQSIRFHLDQRRIQNLYESGKKLKLTGLGELNINWSRMPPGTPKMATVSKTSTGKYFVSFSVDELILPFLKTGKSVGIDIGIKDVVVTSDGYFSGAPKYTKQYEKRLRKANKDLSRKTKGSNRWHKQRIELARVHEKIKSSRMDFLHKLTTNLVRKYDSIAIEDLNVSGMVKNRKLSKAVSDVGMFELKRQLEYKAQWYGKRVVKIDRWFPSTRMCSGCGQIHEMKLSDRTMNCDCGLTLDRDLNAAINIKTEGNSVRGESSSGLKAVA